MSVQKNAAAVRRYLEALDANKPRRGRKRTPDSIKKRLDAIESSLASAGALQRLALVQERLDLSDELEAMDAPNDLGPLEAGFVEVAKEYGSRKGISYTAWREMGVPAEVLKAAGIGQTRRRK
jgi:hypothetical protein